MKAKYGWRASSELKPRTVGRQDRSGPLESTVTAWSGVVCCGGVVRDCGHHHYKRKEALKCAKAWARSLNTNAAARP